MARRAGSLVAAGVLAVLLAGTAAGHESRTVSGFDLEVGMIGEPVYVGERSGMELSVVKDGKPVEGLEATIKVEVSWETAKRALTLQPAGEDVPGYVAPFIPTAAGPYAFHLTGSIEGTAIDETFTASPTGFQEVSEAATGQFPVVLPTLAELAADARQGRDAAALVPVALGVGIAGVVVGMLGLGVALGGRRRRA
jgi:hypothetical protein